ncbi:hypothetical protein PP707_03905 [Acetobacter pasteurianus]|nr:hypothetical protein [Acetobacter pasteurianus]
MGVFGLYMCLKFQLDTYTTNFEMLVRFCETFLLSTREVKRERKREREKTATWTLTHQQRLGDSDNNNNNNNRNKSKNQIPLSTFSPI